MVPQAAQESINLLSDNSSSSENEDVCIGRFVLSKKNDRVDEDILFLHKTDEKITDLTERETLKNTVDGGEEGINPKEFDTNQNVITPIETNTLCNNNGAGDKKYEPENSTGIQIKITCPSCSDILNCAEFCSTDNRNDSCLVNFDNTSPSLHSCNKEIGNVHADLIQNNETMVLRPDNNQRNTTHKCHEVPLNMKNDFLKGDESLLKKNELFLKPNTNNKSINLNMKNDINDTRKYKFYVKTGRKKINAINNTNKKKISSDNVSTEHLPLRNKNQLVRNKSENDKENIKQDDIGCRHVERINAIQSSELQKKNSDKKSFIEKEIGRNKPKRRPNSCPEHQSRQLHDVKRPLTAPACTRRKCCTWDPSRLPEYNGLRSEYGLSEEQLLERRR